MLGSYSHARSMRLLWRALQLAALCLRSRYAYHLDTCTRHITYVYSRVPDTPHRALLRAEPPRVRALDLLKQLVQAELRAEAPELLRENTRRCQRVRWDRMQGSSPVGRTFARGESRRKQTAAGPGHRSTWAQPAVSPSCPQRAMSSCSLDSGSRGGSSPTSWSLARRDAASAASDVAAAAFRRG